MGEGSKVLEVDADRHHVHPLGPGAHLGADVALGRLRDGDHPGHAGQDPHLHPQEGVPAAQAEPTAAGLGVLEVQLAVDGDRVVEGG